MAFDVAAELVSALRSPDGREALKEALTGIIGAEVRAAFERQTVKREKLRTILQVKTDDAARKVEERDAEAGGTLKDLSITIGRQRWYLRHEVEAYLRSKK